MSLGSWLSVEFKKLEITLLKDAAGNLSLVAPQIEGLIDANGPQTIQAVVSAIESADGKALGPLVSSFINSALTAYEGDIAPELEAVVAQGGTSITQNLVTAINQTISKLEVEVGEVPTTHAVATATAEAEPAAEPEPAAPPEPAPAPAAEPEPEPEPEAAKSDAQAETKPE